MNLLNYLRKIRKRIVTIFLRSLVIVVREIQKTEKLLIDFLYENQFKIIGISVIYVYLITHIVGLILIS